MVTALGVAPSLEVCARDGSEVGAGRVAFSVEDGGVLCARCAAGHPPIRLEEEDRAALEFFVAGLGSPPPLDTRHAAAHRRLLLRWVSRHLGEVQLPALTLWQRGAPGR
ncbi:MAG TPA: DNA repair protein RecO C-terminal domain-containing protein [Gemmatimonadales bacterium]|nr:DNA repair protein RecO C-terminal domain-containing protein [Gemmatimonadales bacterium]